MTFVCDALLFDLDGVLVDSRALIERHWRRWAAEHDIPFEEIETVYHGRPSVEVIQAVAPHLDAEAEAQRKRDREAQDTNGLSLLDGAAPLLRSLPEGQWTIATSGTRQTATARLSHVGLPQPDTLVTADDVDEGKPAPEPYRLAAQRLGVAPEQCLVLEDAPVGVTSAKRAGAQVIGVAATSSEASLSNADAVIQRPGDLTVEPTAQSALRVSA
jgi:sugar-phosphatase